MPTRKGHNLSPQDCFSEALSKHRDLTQNNEPEYIAIGQYLNDAKINLARDEKPKPRNERIGWIEFRDEQLASGNIRMSATDAQSYMLIATAHDGDGKRKSKWGKPWLKAAKAWWAGEGNAPPHGQRAYYDMLRAYQNKDKVPKEKADAEESDDPLDKEISGESVAELQGRVKTLWMENRYLRQRLEDLGHPVESDVEIMQSAQSATTPDEDDEDEAESSESDEGESSEQDEDDEAEAEPAPVVATPSAYPRLDTVSQLITVLNNDSNTLNTKTYAYVQLEITAIDRGCSIKELCASVGADEPPHPVTHRLTVLYNEMRLDDPQGWLKAIEATQSGGGSMVDFLRHYGGELAPMMVSAYEALTRKPPEPPKPARGGKPAPKAAKAPVDAPKPVLALPAPVHEAPVSDQPTRLPADIKLYVAMDRASTFQQRYAAYKAVKLAADRAKMTPDDYCAQYGVTWRGDPTDAALSAAVQSDDMCATIEAICKVVAPKAKIAATVKKYDPELAQEYIKHCGNK